VSVGQPWSKLAGSFSRSKSTSNSSTPPQPQPPPLPPPIASLSISSSPGSGTKDKVRNCKVHAGKCSLESTFCLVEGELVGVLLELARRGRTESRRCPCQRWGAFWQTTMIRKGQQRYLVKMETVEVAAGLVGRTQALTKWAVYILERIFHFRGSGRSGSRSRPSRPGAVHDYWAGQTVRWPLKRSCDSTSFHGPPWRLTCDL